MDITRRQITKIAREVSKFTARMMRKDGVGTAEFDLIHAVRKNPGITQAELREMLSLDKGAAARRTAGLEAKGYLIRKENPADKRSRLLYATEKADRLKNSKAAIEAGYYEWLWQGLSESEREQFAALLSKAYLRNKEEARANFANVEPFVKERLQRGDRYEED